MLVAKKIVAGVICCTVLFWAAEVQAEGIFGGKTLGQRLDDLNRSIFGPVDSSEDDSDAPPAKPTAKKSTNENNAVLVPRESAQSRAGSVLEAPQGAKTHVAPANGSNPGAMNRGDRYDRTLQADRRNSAGTTAATNPYRPLLGTSLLDGEESPSSVPRNPGVPKGDMQPNSAQARVVAPEGKKSQPVQISEFGPPPTQSIQSRLMQSRTSAFKNSAVESHPAGSAVGSANVPDESNARVVEPAEPSEAAGVVEEPMPARPPKVPGQPTLAKRPWESDHAGQPIIAQRTTPHVRNDGVGAPSTPRIAPPYNPNAAMDNASDVENPNVMANPRPALNPSANHPTATHAVPAGNKKDKDEGLLFTRRGPVLSVETLGPRKIIVGRESAYEVALQNSGEVAAEDVVVFVNLPEWAEISRADVSAGTPQFQAPGQADVPFQWKVARLDSKAKEKLSLKIIPRQSRPFDLAVRWEMKPTASQTAIEVQEPKLELQLEGPRDVFFGKKETYRLKMMNTGTGNAEGVEVKLLPIGPGENTPATYQLGILPAGEVKSIEIELTARQAGELNIQVEAKGDGGIHASLAEKVLVRRAALEIVVEGPKLQFVGTTATYLVHVKNPGNAPAMNLRMSAKLPAGMKYIGGIDGARTDASGAKLVWSLDSLNPQLERVFAVKCRLGALGATRFDVAATAEDELSTTGGVNTQVEAAASLSLDVQDPAGPISVGDESVYEVRVRNRGTKNADNVEVLVFFSKGFEPTAAEGGPNRFGAGRVVFAPLNSLAPGGEVIFKIRAKAEAAGNHIFRTEVYCKANEIRLISEKNTFYYQDSMTQDAPAANAPVEANRNNGVPETYRTQRR